MLLQELITNLRIELHDTDEQEYTEDELCQAIKKSVELLSRTIPNRGLTELTSGENITDETLTISSGTGTLANQPIKVGSDVIKTGAGVVKVRNTDYTINYLTGVVSGLADADYETSYDLDPQFLDISSYLKNIIRVEKVEYPAGSAPPVYPAWDMLGKYLQLKGDTKYVSGQVLRLYLLKPYSPPALTADGDYPEFLNAAIVIGSSGEVLLSRGVEILNTVSDYFSNITTELGGLDAITTTPPTPSLPDFGSLAPPSAPDISPTAIAPPTPPTLSATAPGAPNFAGISPPSSPSITVTPPAAPNFAGINPPTTPSISITPPDPPNWAGITPPTPPTISITAPSAPDFTGIALPDKAYLPPDSAYPSVSGAPSAPSAPSFTESLPTPPALDFAAHQAALDAVATEIAAAKAFLNTGDDYINAVTAGEDVGAVFGQYANVSLGPATARINEATGRMGKIEALLTDFASKLTKYREAVGLYAAQLSKYSVDYRADIDKYVQGVAVFTTKWADIIGIYATDMDKYRTQVDKALRTHAQLVAKYGSDIDKAIADVNNYSAQLAEYRTKVDKTLTEYSAKIAKYQQDISKANADTGLYSAGLVEYQAKLNKVLTQYGQDVAKYRADIDAAINKVNLFSNEVVLYRVKIDKVLGQYNADVNKYRANIDGEVMKISKFSAEITLYTERINSLINKYAAETNAYRANIDRENGKVGSYNAQVGMYARDLEYYRARVEKAVNKITNMLQMVTSQIGLADRMRQRGGELLNEFFRMVGMKTEAYPISVSGQQRGVAE